ncbi:hypothetical protein [Roseibacillus ishigakijimensis]|uniref:Uncharacterized protein n=1 Tax=Roseibacillus ishigakijimensis TaxID=454146 RepID=A0A934VLV1_9BACT|nr:hypothetical protein [Roseibacillus ishigakijimensis]MBK1835069.1 hypothetical protein [Roseibacillus ishigakijimensis]
MKELFLIMTRAEGPVGEALRKVLAPLGTVEIVVDQAPEEGEESKGIGLYWYENELLAGYEGLMSNTSYFPLYTAWSRAFYHLAQCERDFERVWLVEDDVAGDAASFSALVRETARLDIDYAAEGILSRAEHPQWYWWRNYGSEFADPYRAFQPLCCLSREMVTALLADREKRGRFLFHEFHFPSLAVEQGVRIMDWTQSPLARRCFSVFRYRPPFLPDGPGVCHPVKDASAAIAHCRSVW